MWKELICDAGLDVPLKYKKTSFVFKLGESVWEKKVIREPHGKKSKKDLFLPAKSHATVKLEKVSIP